MSCRRRALLAASPCILLGAARARAQPAASLAERAARRFPQPVRVGDLLRRHMLLPLESQPSLGRVRGVVTRPDGSIAVVLDYGGLLGFFTRPIAVPVEAVTLLGEHMVMQELTVAQLDRLPDFDATGTTPLAADAVIRIGLSKPVH